MNPRYSRYYIYIKPVLQSRVVKTYGGLVFSLFTITIFGLFAIRPTLATIVSLKKSISEQQNILKQLTGKAETLSLGKKNFDALDPEIKTKVFTLLPNSTSIPRLLEEISALASSKQASVSGIQYQPVDLKGATKDLSKNGSLKEVEFSMNAQGSYLQLVSFIDGLGKLSRLITIKNITFNKQPEGPLSLSINAKAYFVKD